jgi:small subunit ribosomal protein S2
MVDTNSDPSSIDFVIPSNDDATKSIELILGALCKAIQEGIEEGKIERGNKGDEGEEPPTETAGPRRDRKARARKPEEAPERETVKTEGRKKPETTPVNE